MKWYKMNGSMQRVGQFNGVEYLKPNKILYNGGFGHLDDDQIFELITFMCESVY